MPHSDDLYSANDDAPSESESFSNELSPTDGFFHASSTPNRMVPDPSLDHKDRAEEDKVLIPRSETRNQSGSTSRSATSPTLGSLFPSQNHASSHSNNVPASPSISSYAPSSPTSHRRTERNIFSEPSQSARGPPPAYTPSSPATSSPSTYNRSSNTFEPSRFEQPSIPELQSMGRPDEEPDENTPLSEFAVKKPSRRRNFVKKVLFFALVVAVALGIMSSLLHWGQSVSKKDPNAPGGELPPGNKPPSIGLPSDGNGPYCAVPTEHAGEFFIDAPLSGSLAVLQTTYDPDPSDHSSSYSVTTTGELRIRRMPKNTKYSTRGLAQLDVHETNGYLNIKKYWDEDTHTLNVSTPRNTKTVPHPIQQECISLEITIWLPEDASLTSLIIASTTLTVRVFDDIKIEVLGKAEFGSVSGDIIFPNIGSEDEVPPQHYPLDSRHITVETVSGNIRGVYPLFDYLKLGSQSGDIQAGIIPQSVLPAEPTPADLEISTSSGGIRVNLPIEIRGYNPPPRDYVTRVSSISGKIEGTYFLGSLGSFKSTSGDLIAKVQPVIQYSPSTDPDDAPESKFESWSMSGKHGFEVLEPIFISLLLTNGKEKHDHEMHGHDQHERPVSYVPIGDGDPYRILPPTLNEDAVLEARGATATKKWRTLKSSHTSSAAKVAVLYPDAWEGTLAAKTVSGDIGAEGDDLKIIKYSKGWAYKAIIAGKNAAKVGEGSTASMSSISGSLDFFVGKEERDSWSRA